MKVRGTGLATIGAALSLAALVAVIGAAQAAPQTKKYSATVHVADGVVTETSATLTLTITNKTRSQTLGSAEFSPPAGVSVQAIVAEPVRTGWDAELLAGSVRLRSTSNALGLNESVSADVSVTVDQTVCTNAAWTTRAKQSNDFSGNPGNDFQFDAAGSDVTPLGSFAVAPPIVTVKGGQTIPALETGTSFEWTATAYDLCGERKESYRDATLTPTFLTDATFDPVGGQSLKWESGVGTVTFTPSLTETGNRLTVTDTETGVTASSNFFDVSDTLCVPGNDPCVWPGDKISALADAPPINANLGIGFNNKLNFECNGTGDPIGGAVVNINPRGYGEASFTVELTYAKSSIRNGSASQFVVCFSKANDGTAWQTMPSCPASPPCVLEKKKTSGGDLRVVLYLTQEDPWTGLG